MTLSHENSLQEAQQITEDKMAALKTQMQAQEEEKIRNQGVDIQHIKNLLLKFWRADDESVKNVIRKVIFAALDVSQEEQDLIGEKLQ